MGESGLMLIEILIGLLLTALVAGMILWAMRLGYSSEANGRKREEVAQRMRIISDRITWLLRGAYPYTVVEEGETTIYFEGDLDKVGFVTTSVDDYSEGPEDLAGLKWVEIYADDGLKINENVFFLEDALEGYGGKEYVFDPTVKSIEFEYLDIEYEEDEEAADVEAEEGKGVWVTDWSPTDKDYLPSAVRAKVVFEMDGKDYEIPNITAAIRSVKKDLMRR